MSVFQAYMQGRQARRAEDQAMRQNMMQQYMQQNAQGIFQGDQGALSGLAAYDPVMAIDIRNSNAANRRAEAAAGRDVAMHNLQMDQIGAEMTAAEREAAAAEIRQTVQRGLALYRSGRLDQAGFDEMVSQDPNTAWMKGMDPEEAAGTLMSVADQLEMGQQEPSKPGNDYERYAARERAAGREPMDEFAYRERLEGIKGDNGMSVELPDGTRVQVGGGRTEDKMDIMGAGSMIDSINAILNDPALEKATGLLEWTQAVPGTDAYRFGTRVKQLQGQAFLQAFQALKGGGQITEIEGQKATEAIGRLDSGQSAEDYRQALTELRDVLGRAMQRPRGWTDTRAGKISTMSAAEIGELDLMALSPEERAAARQRLEDIVSAGQ